MESAVCAQKIKIVVLDVDGVLTNGQIYFDGHGEAFKAFHTQDGLGLAAAKQAGLKTAIITGRTSDMVRLRAQELKIDELHQGAESKILALQEIMDKYHLTLGEVAYVGDDLNDLPILSVVGLPCTVANAVPEVKKIAKLIASHAGGQGAVREIIEFILKAQGEWEKIVAHYAASRVFDITQ